jgi:hypothetical protein
MTFWPLPWRLPDTRAFTSLSPTSRVSSRTKSCCRLHASGGVYTNREMAVDLPDGGHRRWSVQARLGMSTVRHRPPNDKSRPLQRRERHWASLC